MNSMDSRSSRCSSLGGHVQGGGDLVGDDHVRPPGQCPRQRDPLPLAAGQLARQPVHGARRQPDLLDEPLGLAAPGGAPGDRAARNGLGDRLAGGHPRVEGRVRVLEHHLQRPPPAPRHRLAVEQDRARGRGDEPDGGARQGRLAGTRLADQPDHVPGRHHQVHRLGGDVRVPARAVAHGHVVEPQLAHASAPSG
jgi:hypothetical protein